MTISIRKVLPASFAIAVAACASGPKPTTTDQTGQLRWSGSLQPQQQRVGGLGPANNTRAFGTVMLSRSQNDPDRTRVDIRVDAPIKSTTVGWALVPGRCGSSALPVMGLSQFPTIEINNQGRGQLSTEIPLTLPSNGSYHVDVFWSTKGSDLSDVMTCANLKVAGGK